MRNGSCQWSDTFSESIWFSRDDSSKEADDCLLKLIVAMVLSLKHSLVLRILLYARLFLFLDHNHLKQFETSLFGLSNKSQGSLRSGILGEATVKMNSYVSSDTAIPLSIPLKKCNHGTVLHVSHTTEAKSYL